MFVLLITFWLGHAHAQCSSGNPYVHIEKPVCTEGNCNYEKNIRRPQSVQATKRKISESLRILSNLGMSEGIDGHISVRTGTPNGGDPAKMYLLMDRFGVGWNIIEPHHIITIECGTKRIVESNWKSVEWRAAIWMNDAIHQIRPDVQVVLHLHSPYTRILGTTDSPLEMIDQNSLRFYNKIGYHDYEGVVVDPTKSESLASKIKDYDILILKNHGSIILANSIEEAFNRAYFLENAAKAQIDAYKYAASIGKPVVPIAESVVLANWKKFQGQAERLFAYFHFESWRRFYGLVHEYDETLFYEESNGNQ